MQTILQPAVGEAWMLMMMCRAKCLEIELQVLPISVTRMASAWVFVFLQVHDHTCVQKQITQSWEPHFYGSVLSGILCVVHC